METTFKDAFDYKVIYVFTIDDECAQSRVQCLAGGNPVR